MEPIDVTRILVYHDGPQVFEGRSPNGGHYLGVMAPGSGVDPQYIVLPIAPMRIGQLRSGAVDLRDAMGDRDERLGWHLARIADGDGQHLVIDESSNGDIPADYLPDAGFFLAASTPGNEVLTEAKERGNLVVALTLEPPESVDSHRIKAQTLGQVLIHFQKLYMRAYGHARKSVESLAPSAPPLNAYATAPSSYRIYLEAAGDGNLFGASEVGPAMEIVDSLFLDIAHVEDVMESVKQYKGHFATAYRDLLRVLVTSQARLEYRYADAISTDVRGGMVSVDNARTITELIDEQKELTSEEITFTGKLDVINSATGKWRLSVEGKNFYGETTDDGPQLSGLVVDQTYTFRCQERLISQGDGSERTVHFLVEIVE